MIPLAELSRCFQGVVPSYLATCSADGVPNVTPLSQVFFVDDRHVALSCQFFNKTQRNVAENPHACVHLQDPLTLQSYALRLRFDHSETEGPLFDGMAMRIQVIAAHTGMAGVFKLRSADVYEVVAVERTEGMWRDDAAVLEPCAARADGLRTELRSLQCISERISRAGDMRSLVASALGALEDLFGVGHSIMFIADDAGERLTAVASRGYPEGTIGGEVCVGEGLIGTVAQQRRLLRVSGLGAELRYGRSIRERVRARDGDHALGPELPIPGLADAHSKLVLPLTAADRMVGVLTVESRDPLAFDEWDEAFLEVVANQIAIATDNLLARELPRGRTREALLDVLAAEIDRLPARAFCFYRNDDCVFVDGEYLVRNIPGKILWKLLTLHARDGRTEFSNRELRLDPSLGLPPIKDNLESRLILLRKRLAERCPEVRLVPTRRGRFELELDCRIELSERDTAES